MFTKSPGLDETLQSISNEYKTLKSQAKDSFLKEYIGAEIWRYFIDGDRQNAGEAWLTYVTKVDSHLTQASLPYSILNLKISDLSDEKITTEITQKGEASFKSNFDNYLAEIDNTNTEITIKDSCLRNRGWLTFENTEEGYLKPLVHTLLELENKDAEIDAHFIKSLHAKATDKVKNLAYDKENIAVKRGNFRESEIMGYTLQTINCTREGLKEYLDTMKHYSQNFPDIQLLIMSSEHTYDYISIKHISHTRLIDSLMEQLEDRKPLHLVCSINKNLPEQKIGDILDGHVTQLLASYERTIKEAKTPSETLRCIVTLIRDLERLHPFNDANCRTFCMLLLPQLLMKHGFPPPMQMNPNQFDCYSTDELITELVQGMQNTLDIATKRKDKLFDVSTDEVLKVATQQELAYAAELGITFRVQPTAKTVAEAKPSELGMFKKEAKQAEQSPAQTIRQTRSPSE